MAQANPKTPKNPPGRPSATMSLSSQPSESGRAPDHLETGPDWPGSRRGTRLSRLTRNGWIVQNAAVRMTTGSGRTVVLLPNTPRCRLWNGDGHIGSLRACRFFSSSITVLMLRPVAGGLVLPPVVERVKGTTSEGSGPDLDWPGGGGPDPLRDRRRAVLSGQWSSTSVCQRDAVCLTGSSTPCSFWAVATELGRRRH